MHVPTNKILLASFSSITPPSHLHVDYVFRPEGSRITYLSRFDLESGPTIANQRKHPLTLGL